MTPRPTPRCEICGDTTWEVVQRPHPLYRNLTSFAIPCTCLTNRSPQPDTKLAAAGRDA